MLLNFKRQFLSLLSFFSISISIFFPSPFLSFPFLVLTFFRPFLSLPANDKKVFTGAAASSAMSKVNCTLLVRFVKTIKTPDLRAHFNIGRLYVKQFVEEIKFSNAAPDIKIVDVIMVRASARFKPLKLTTFASLPDPNFRKIGTGQVRQILQASFAVVMYARNDSRVRDFFSRLFRAKQSSVALINGSQFL